MVCSLYDDSGTSSEQATLVQEAHSIIHQLLLHAPVCAVPGLPDGWTFIADPEATSQDVGINQVCAIAWPPPMIPSVLQAAPQDKQCAAKQVWLTR